MSKWRYRGDDDENSEKIGKMRKKNRARKTADAHDQFEKSESTWPLTENKDYFAARVVEVHKRYAFVSPEKTIGKIKTRDPWLATVARKFLTVARQERNLIVVGDRVLCRPTGEKEADIGTDLPCCVILNLAPRKSKISRLDPITQDREHVLASNVDQLVVVASYLAPPVKWGLVDRYLVLAEEQHLPVTLIFTKSDLLDKDKDPDFFEECERETAYFRALGYPVYSVSTLPGRVDKDMVAELKQVFKDKITILSGHSGVGKSSVINLFKPEIVQEVEENPDIFYKGRHTTTYASLIKLGSGGYVVDTPGIRSFLLDERDALQLTYGFREFRALLGQCKYRECRHMDEPDCAVQRAVEEGVISQRRYRSYCGLLLRDTGREGRTRELDLDEE